MEVGVLGAQRAAMLAALLVAGLVVGCGTVGGSAGQQAVPPVEPASAPLGGPAPAGTIRPLGAPATAVVVDPRSKTIAVALDDPPRLLLTTLDGTAPPRQVPLPGPAADLVLAADGGPLLVPITAPGSLIRVVALDGNRVIPGFIDATRLIAAPDEAKVWVLDRGRSAVSVVDLSTGEISPVLRAGNGAASAVADRFGRLLVTDTRDGELLAFAGDPPVLRQRFPLPGAPYGLAYDGRRDLVWVTLTGRDEVVGLGVAGGEPVIVHRLPTVHQPDAVAADPVSGRVYIVSASGAGLQVIDPERVVQ
jgi:DNA-binding beta-propeller fold protein YncE